MPTGPLIDADALAAALAEPEPTARPAVLDVRWDLAAGPRPDLYAEAHIPGAAFVDLDLDLAAPVGDGRGGRHPLPDLDAFTRAMRAAGVDHGRPVVAYDAAGGTIAARAWWLLCHHGHPDVAVLDGGLPAWIAAGHPTEAGAERTAAPGPGDFTATTGRMQTLDAAGAAALGTAADGVLLDARPPERFRGDSEPVDPAAGHIPGARSRPTRDNLGADGRFADSTALAAHFAELGATPQGRVGVYCGSGVTAAHQVLALALSGVDAALYPGSWSEWCSDPARPVATGDG